VILAVGLMGTVAAAELPYADGDLYADTWVATDAVGRTQPALAEAGSVKKHKS